MTALLLISSLLFAVLAFIAIRLYRDVRRPSPLAIGCIIPKVCVVNSQEVFRFCQIAGEEQPLPAHLRSEARSKLSRIYWTFLRQMAWNTRRSSGRCGLSNRKLTRQNLPWPTSRARR